MTHGFCFNLLKPFKTIGRFVLSFTMRDRPQTAEAKDPGLLKKAASIVLLEKRSARSVAAEFDGVCQGTLSRFVSKLKKVGPMNNPEDVQRAMEEVHLRYKRKVFTEEQERQLTEYMKAGASQTEMRKLAFETAQAFEINMPESWKKKKCAGPDWYSAFVQRNASIIINSPSRCSHAVKHSSPFGFVSGQISNECSPIIEYASAGPTQTPDKLIEKSPVDESCPKVDCVLNECGPIIDTSNAPSQSTNISDELNEASILLFLQHFIDYNRPSKKQPVLLLMDNQESDLSDKVLNLAKENGIILSFPPHTSLQTINVYNFHRNALQDTSSKNVANGFRKCGVMSFHRDVLPDDHSPPICTNTLSKKPFQDIFLPKKTMKKTSNNSQDCLNAETQEEDKWNASTGNIQPIKICPKERKRKPVVLTDRSGKEHASVSIKTEPPIAKKRRKDCQLCNISRGTSPEETDIVCTICVDWSNIKLKDKDYQYICMCHVSDSDD